MSICLITEGGGSTCFEAQFLRELDAQETISNDAASFVLLETAHSQYLFQWETPDSYSVSSADLCEALDGELPTLWKKSSLVAIDSPDPTLNTQMENEQVIGLTFFTDDEQAYDVEWVNGNLGYLHYDASWAMQDYFEVAAWEVYQNVSLADFPDECWLGDVEEKSEVSPQIEAHMFGLDRIFNAFDQPPEDNVYVDRLDTVYDDLDIPDDERVQNVQVDILQNWFAGAMAFYYPATRSIHLGYDYLEVSGDINSDEPPRPVGNLVSNAILAHELGHDRWLMLEPQVYQRGIFKSVLKYLVEDGHQLDLDEQAFVYGQYFLSDSMCDDNPLSELYAYTVAREYLSRSMEQTGYCLDPYFEEEEEALTCLTSITDSWSQSTASAGLAHFLLLMSFDPVISMSTQEEACNFFESHSSEELWSDVQDILHDFGGMRPNLEIAGQLTVPCGNESIEPY